MVGKNSQVVARRSSELRYSEPSKPYLTASIRAALNAKVARPMMTPISTPAMKPHCTMMTMIASSDTYSVFESRRRDSMIHLCSWSAPRQISSPPSTNFGM